MQHLRRGHKWEANNGMNFKEAGYNTKPLSGAHETGKATRILKKRDIIQNRYLEPMKQVKRHEF
jgi:hypothetical protein